jgi:hypothetical protein
MSTNINELKFFNEIDSLQINVQKALTSTDSTEIKKALIKTVQKRHSQGDRSKTTKTKDDTNGDGQIDSREETQWQREGAQLLQTVRVDANADGKYEQQVQNTDANGDGKFEKKWRQTMPIKTDASKR